MVYFNNFTAFYSNSYLTFFNVLHLYNIVIMSRLIQRKRYPGAYLCTYNCYSGIRTYIRMSQDWVAIKSMHAIILYSSCSTNPHNHLQVQRKNKEGTANMKSVSAYMYKNAGYIVWQHLYVFAPSVPTEYPIQDALLNY